MKILGIDYGTKRIGIAVSDESQTFARELAIVPAGQFMNQLPALISQQEIEAIVIGLPLNMAGQDTEKTREARQFKEKVAAVSGLPVHMMDERLSSSMAQSLPGGRKNIDSLAAQIILQNYLDIRQK